LDKYLIDTEIWIQYLQGKDEKIRQRIQTLLDEDRISINGIILSELLVAATGKNEFQFIKEHFSGLHFLSTDRDFYVRLAKISREFSKNGQDTSFQDLVKATHAYISGLTLISRNGKLKQICQVLGVGFQEI